MKFRRMRRQIRIMFIIAVVAVALFYILLPLFFNKTQEMHGAVVSTASLTVSFIAVSFFLLALLSAPAWSCSTYYPFVSLCIFVFLAFLVPVQSFLFILFISVINIFLFAIVLNEFFVLVDGFFYGFIFQMAIWGLMAARAWLIPLLF